MRKRQWKQFYALEPNPIGRGGQAEVFRALERHSEATVALKRLITSSSDGVARMRREIEVQQRLTHPRIMPVLRHGDDYTWYSMPLARRSLKDLHPPLSDPIIQGVVSASVEALIAAHQLGYVHRDITPSNLLDTASADDPYWVISDWGLVRRHGLTTLTRTQAGEFGTAGFAAPETWVDAHSADERADLYSLGRVVAWAATGVVPIPNVPLVPGGRWAAFVRAATAAAVEDRPRNATALLELCRPLPASETAPVQGGVPPDIAAVIRTHAERAHPDDFSTQKFVIERDTRAFHQLKSLALADVPAEVMSLIASRTAREHPGDFFTQLFVIEREAEAWRALQSLDMEVPTAVLSRIVAKARLEHPSDFSTQLFVVKREAEAWAELSK